MKALMPAATSPYDFVEEEEEQAIEHDVGARGQGAIGRVGFVTFGYYRWIGIASKERRPPGRDASDNVDVW